MKISDNVSSVLLVNGAVSAAPYLPPAVSVTVDRQEGVLLWGYTREFTLPTSSISLFHVFS